MTAAILLAAVAIDVTFGEWQRWHPVAGLGRMLAWFRPAAELSNAWAQNIAGMVALLTTAVTAGVLAWLFEQILALQPWFVALPIAALALKPSFSIRRLLEVGCLVETALLAGDLAAAQKLLATHLVSRDTSQLTKEQCRQATISSLAENLTDSIVAPFFYFVVLGLPGAWIYRTINTADAMFGYKTPQLEHFGWAAARADDIVNFLPARATALFIVASAFMRGQVIALRQLLIEAGKTPSPNGGWTMGAMALALDVRLEKTGVYVLNPSGRLPNANDFALSVQLSSLATLLSLLAAMGTAIVCG